MGTASVPKRTDFYVYALFKADGRVFYIGKGTGRRWTAHERQPDNSIKSKIIRKTKADLGFLPKEKLIENLTDEEARRCEVDLIRLVGRWPLGPLVNHTDGGDGMANPSEETRQKLRLSRLGKKRTAEHCARIGLAQVGKKLSPEFLTRIGSWNKGRKASEETRKKLSDARKGRQHSPETCAKIGAAHRGRKKSPEQIEKFRLAVTGRKASDEARANMRAARLRSIAAARRPAPQLSNSGA